MTNKEREYVEAKLDYFIGLGELPVSKRCKMFIDWIFTADNTANYDFIKACAMQQEAIQKQAEEYKQAREPAFPAYYHDFTPSTGVQVVRDMDSGISKRDYFAAAALTGFLAAGEAKFSFADVCKDCDIIANQLISALYKD